MSGLEASIHYVQGDLERARDRIRELEATNKRLADQYIKHFQLCTRAQDKTEQLCRALRTVEAEFRSMERKLEDAVLEASQWKHAAEMAKRRR